MTTQPIVVWTELPVRDLAAAITLYDALLGTTSTIDRSGPVPMANLTRAEETVGCSLVEGEPGRGTVLHFNVAALDAAADILRAAGGKVTSDPIAIPQGRFVYAEDPDGNKIGLFEPKG